MPLKDTHLNDGDYFVIIASSILPFLIVDNVNYKSNGGRTVEVTIDNERLIVVFALRPYVQTNFALSCFSLRHINVLKRYVLHLQHNYFTLFNQSDLDFLALSFPFPSSLFKPHISVFKKLRRLLQRKRHIQTETLGLGACFAIIPYWSRCKKQATCSLACLARMVFM